MCPMRPCGHGALPISTSGIRIANTRAQRSNRKVSGGAYGNPNLATMNPVLQSSTKNRGIGFNQDAVCRVATFFKGMFDIYQ